MKIRIPFIVGAAIGYVLGTKAGRERYEQIVQQSRRLAESPRVQETAGVLRAKSGELADTARDRFSARRQGQRPEGVERLPGREARTEAEGSFTESSTGMPSQPTQTGGPGPQ